jgi:hypothetical protein
MPAAVKIKAGKYGGAIGLLLERGGAFQTRYERTLIVNAEQMKALEEANLVEGPPSKRRGSRRGPHLMSSCTPDLASAPAAR